MAYTPPVKQIINQLFIIMEFLKNNRQYIIAILLYVIAIMIFVNLPNMRNNQPWVFWVTLTLATINVAYFNDKNNIRKRLAMLAGAYLLVLDLCWALPINPAWATIPVLITGIGFCIFTGFSENETIYIPIGVAAGALLLLS